MEKYCFNQVAEIYDDYYNTDLGSQIDKAEKRGIYDFLNYFESKNLLEVGCGTGHWTVFFAEHNFKITGIDISDKMLENAKKKNIPNASFRIENVENLSFADNSVDNVIAITFLEFVSNLEKSISEIKRVLKPSGCFLIACLNLNSPIGKMKSENEVFKNAHFFESDELFEILSGFGKPQIDGCGILENDKVLDTVKVCGTSEFRKENACMLIGFVKKENCKKTLCF
jgi:ubiquinone/menaquinone biosynthesis C-methylase UbiE